MIRATVARRLSSETALRTAFPRVGRTSQTGFRARVLPLRLQAHSITFARNTLADTTTRLAHLRQFSHILDSAIRIPGTRFRVGMDGLLGLIPGVGDVTTGLASVFIIMTAARMGVPRAVLTRMIMNVAIDTAVGVVPLVGDVFDMAFKSNQRNVALTERYMTAPLEERRRTERVSRLQLIGLIVALVIVVVLGIVGAMAIVRWIFQAAQAMGIPG